MNICIYYFNLEFPNRKFILFFQSFPHQDSYETAVTERTHPRQDSFETAQDDYSYDDEYDRHDEYYEEDYYEEEGRIHLRVRFVVDFF